jgi:histidinol-phosphate/aromatic aminotransferase/cobyric acid decarboxylase-like protein
VRDGMPKREPGQRRAGTEPGEHGGDAPRLALALGCEPGDLLDLSKSLNPLAPAVGPLVARHLDTLVHYPDAARATAALAEALAADPRRVLLTNGGAEAIALVAGALGRGRVDEPDFALYRRHLPIVDPDGPRFRSNPHSPSGRLAPPDEAAAVWDEAFYPLATGRWTRGDAEHGAIVVGSLTKLFACPGLRLGYVLAPDEVTREDLARRQPAWSVGSLALAVLPDLLAAADLDAWARGMAGLRADLVGALVDLGFAPQAADANWVLVPAPGLRAALLEHRIVVRDCATFGLRDTVRIAVPDPAGLDRLVGALDAVAGRGRASPQRRRP